MIFQNFRKLADRVDNQNGAPILCSRVSQAFFGASQAVLLARANGIKKFVIFFHSNSINEQWIKYNITTLKSILPFMDVNWSEYRMNVAVWKNTLSCMYGNCQIPCQECSSPNYASNFSFKFSKLFTWPFLVTSNIPSKWAIELSALSKTNISSSSYSFMPVLSA